MSDIKDQPPAATSATTTQVAQNAAPQENKSENKDAPVAGDNKQRARSRSPDRKRSRSPRRGSRSPRRSRSPKRTGAEESCKLYIGNISYRANDRDMRDAFEKYGKVTDILIPEDRATGRQRGFCFVSFESERDADDALKNMDGRELDGRTIRVSKARSDGKGQGGQGGPRGGDRGNGGYGGDRGGDRGGGRGGDRGSGNKEPCRDFTRGNCSRGDRCRYDHSGGGGGDKYNDAPPRFEGSGGNDQPRGGYQDRYDDNRGAGNYGGDRGYGGQDRYGGR